MKILQDSFIYLSGELFAKALPFLLLPYLTRKLGVADFGELAYYQTILALLTLFFSLSQDGALTRYFYFYGKRLLPQLMFTAYSYTACLTALGLLWAWWQQSLLLAAVMAAAAGQTLIGTQLAWRQCQQHALAYVSIQIASGLLTSVLTVLFLEMSQNASVNGRLMAVGLGNLAVAACAYFAIKPKPNRHFTRQRFYLSGCYVLSFGSPLLLHQISGFAKGQLDRILIYQNHSSQSLGLYAAALQVAGILSILLFAINKAVVPHFYHALKQGRLNAGKVRRLMLASLLVVPLPALVASRLPESLFTWFLGPHYAGTHRYIVLFLLGFGLTIPYFILVNYLFFYGKNKLISIISLASTVIYMMALYGLLPHGLPRLPYAMIAGNLAILPILYYFVREPKQAA